MRCAPQPLVVGVEQAVFLEPAAAQRRGAEREDPRARLVGTVETKLDLAFERHGPGRLFLADGDELLLAVAQHQQERGAARRHLAELAGGFLRRA